MFFSTPMHAALIKPDILVEIFSYASVGDAARISMVHSSWRVEGTRIVWRKGKYNMFACIGVFLKSKLLNSYTVCSCVQYRRIRTN